MSFHLITCVVEKGKAQKVAAAAFKAGAQAVTCFDAKGRGPWEKSGRKGLSAKEIIFTVTNSEATFIVFDEIVATAQLKEPGKGFAIIQEVDKTIGFFDGMYKEKE